MHDLLILGGGPAGYRAAELAAQAGLKTILFEAGALGGVCLNEGCIPSKTLLHSTKILEHARSGAAYGVEVENVRFHLPAVMARKQKIVKQLTTGVHNTVRSAGAEIIMRPATIQKIENGVVYVAAGGQSFAAQRVLIATGSEIIFPPIAGLPEALRRGFAITSREALSIESVPESLLVIGAGVVGLEMAGFFRAAGSEVDVVELTGQIGGAMDRETAAALRRQYERRGIRFHLDSRVTQVKEDEEIVVAGPDGERVLTAQTLLLAAGRKPRVEGYGLEHSGVVIDRGRIPTDAFGMTNVPGVYAAGDVNGKWMLAHAAYREAETAVAHMLGKHTRMRYDAMPSVIYTQPEVASVGLTEEQCTGRQGGVLKATVPMGVSGRFLAETHRETGFCKVLADSIEQRLLGCHIVGPYASEIIVAAGILIESEIRLEALREYVFPHPTVGEVLREAFFRL